MSEITVVVRIQAKPGCEDLLERELRTSVAPTHTEAGCIRFALHRGVNDRSVFVLVERWRSDADLQEHLQKPYVKKVLHALERLAESPQDGVYQQLIEGDTEKRL